MVLSKTINVNTVMHNNTDLRISEEAVLEMKSFIELKIESYMPMLEMFAKDNKRLTIMSEDIIHLFAYKNLDEMYISKRVKK